MSAVQPFTFPDTGQPVRTVALSGEPWFVASDVTAVLGYSNGRMAVGSLPDRMKGSVTIADGTPGNPNKAIVSEPGVYRLVMRSNLPAAERFQDWLAEEVIPSIRRTGSYSVALPKSLPEALRAYATEVEAHEATKGRVAELEPAADAWNTLAEAKGDYSVREAAQILDRDPTVSTGQNRLFAYLREIRWIDSGGQPYQTHVDNGRLVCRPTSYTHPHKDEPVLTSQVRITVKGVKTLRRLLSGEQTSIPMDGDQ